MRQHLSPLLLFVLSFSGTAFAQSTIDLSHSRATIDDSSAIISDWRLTDFRKTLTKDALAVTLADVTAGAAAGVATAFDHKEFTYLNDVKGKLTQNGSEVRWSYEDAKVKLTRTVTPDASGLFLNVRYMADFKTETRPGYFFALLKSHSPEKDEEERDRQLSFYANKSIERLHLSEELELAEHQGDVKWVAASSRYFLIALLPEASAAPKILVQPRGPRSAQIGLIYSVAQKHFETSFRVYFGAKDLNILRKIEPTLDTSVDFGFFTFVAYPILRMMKWLYGIVANYGVAIILVTLLIKLITFPLNYKSMKAMKEMQRLQPRIKALQERHKNDRETLNREMLSLMRTHGYNPLAGCMPILIQMPVFFALYQVLYSAVELYQAPFALWIHDLSAKDPFYVTPLLLTGAMFLQQRLTPAQPGADPAQQKILHFMPVLFGALMLTLPSGLTLYMLVNALVSILQQLALNKKFGNENKLAVVDA